MMVSTPFVYPISFVVKLARFIQSTYLKLRSDDWTVSGPPLDLSSEPYGLKYPKVVHAEHQCLPEIS
jgi:hypothetical protein